MKKIKKELLENGFVVQLKTKEQYINLKEWLCNNLSMGFDYTEIDIYEELQDRTCFQIVPHDNGTYTREFCYPEWYLKGGIEVLEYEDIWEDDKMTTKERMKMIANSFGLELGEEFNIIINNNEYSNYSPHKFIENRIVDKDGFDDVGKLERLLSGDYKVEKIPWKPKCQEMYYYPKFNTDDIFGYSWWDDDYYENNLYDRGLIFKTKQEAVDMAKKMLKVVKES